MHTQEPAEFPTALSASFGFVLLVYQGLSALAYMTYGSAVADNVLQNVPENALRTAAVVLITAHVLFAFALYLNPVFYLVEEDLGIEMASGAKQSPAQVCGAGGLTLDELEASPHAKQCTTPHTTRITVRHTKHTIPRHIRCAVRCGAVPCGAVRCADPFGVCIIRRFILAGLPPI